MTIEQQIADELLDAVRATDRAYDVAREAWGVDDPRTEAIVSAWSEVETVFQRFNEEGK